MTSKLDHGSNMLLFWKRVKIFKDKWTNIPMNI